MSIWHYVKNGQKEGPVEPQALQQMIQSGSLPSNTLVWKTGQADWVAANTLPDFAAVAGMVPPPVAAGSDSADVEKNKVFAVLAYFGILVLVPILAARESKFAMYHANQGLILLILCIASGIPLMILFTVLAYIPILGPLICMALWGAYGIGIMILWILGIINAAQGQMKPLPVIGNLFTLIK